MTREGNAPELPVTEASGPPGRPGPGGEPPAGWRPARREQVIRFMQAVRDSDQAAVDAAILKLSRAHRWLAPLALALGAFAMLLEGVKLLFSNWRLTLIQVLPAMWIWVAMYDLKAHVVHGKDFHVPYGPELIPIVFGVTVITAASFFLNAVFGYAIAGPQPPLIRPAFTQARSHLVVILGSGAVVGVLLGVSAMVVPHFGLFWFAVSLSIVLGVMMICYVAVPARLIGMKTTYSKRDKLTASAVGGAIGAVICTPPYVLGRVGVILLGSGTLFVLGIILLTVGVALQAGATGAVKTIKMSAKLVAGHRQDVEAAPPPDAHPASG